MAVPDMSWFFAASITPTPVAINNLFTSASKGDLATLTEALDKGEEDVAVNGWRAVHSASAKGHLECLKLLHQRVYNGDIAHTGLISVLTSSGENVLHLAACKGKVDACQYIIEQAGREIIHIRNAEDYTAVHLAAYNGHEAVLKLLVALGGDAGVTTEEGVTPLLLAASAGQEAAFDYLASLEEGKLLCAVSKSGLTPLHKASSGGYENIVRKCLDSKKIPVDSESESGACSLHMASQNGYLSTVKLLVDAGADVCKENNMGQTALHKAAFEGNLKVVNLLLENKADANALDVTGHSVLMCAASGGRHRVIDRLCNDISLKVNIETQLKDGEDAQILAANNGFHEVASKLTRLMYINARRNNLLTQITSSH